MDAKGYSRIPRELCYWITFLAEALPLRSVGTFIELLIGAMLTTAGFVTCQVRIDTRLYDEPPKRKKGQRGRPRKYGRKYTPKRIAHAASHGERSEGW